MISVVRFKKGKLWLQYIKFLRSGDVKSHFGKVRSAPQSKVYILQDKARTSFGFED